MFEVAEEEFKSNNKNQNYAISEHPMTHVQFLTNCTMLSCSEMCCLVAFYNARCHIERNSGRCFLFRLSLHLHKYKRRNLESRP